MKSVYKLYWENHCALSALVLRAGAPLHTLITHPTQFPAGINSEVRALLENRANIITKIVALEGKKTVPSVMDNNVINLDAYRIIELKPK